MARPVSRRGLSTQICRCLLIAVPFCAVALLPLRAVENGLNQIAAMSQQEFAEVQKKASHGDRTAEAIMAIA